MVYVMIIKKFDPEQHRQGQKAAGFDPECRVVSAALYNSVIDKYNKLLTEYNNVSKLAIHHATFINPFD